MKLIKEYVENPNSIILAVSSADADLATSESLKIANEVDPEGKRTLAVLTKLDRMESYTEGIDILSGTSNLKNPVKLGIIGIVNRGKSERTIEEQLEVEKDFLEEKFPGIAHRNGVLYLEKSLSTLLMQHIQECLPNLKDRVSKKLDHYGKVMEICGEEVIDKNRTISKIISKFDQEFKDIIAGVPTASNAAVLTQDRIIGGPAIRKVFDEKFGKEIQSIEPQISKNDIINYIKRIGGPRPTVFAPEILFETIVKQQIQRLLNPSLKCAENIQKEMEKIIKHQVKHQLEADRFPVLLRKLQDVMMKLLIEQMPRTMELIKNIIETELSCINTNHPDFSIREVLKEYEQKNQPDKNNNAV